MMQSTDMNAELMDRYRTILSREFTSSDEEVDDETAGAAAGDEEVQQLRVRHLIWESSAVHGLKGQLDQVYLTRFATPKQQASLSRCLRDGIRSSKRVKPVNCPAWAYRQ